MFDLPVSAGGAGVWVAPLEASGITFEGGRLGRLILDSLGTLLTKQACLRISQNALLGISRH